MIAVDDLTTYQGERRVLDQVGFSARSGALTIVCGPNGAGKSTLLRAMVGLTPVTSGSVTFDARLITDMADDERARAIAYLPQDRRFHWPIAVRDAVALGRFAHGGSTNAAQQHAAVARAIEQCGLDDLQHRAVDRLSGGEQARVHLARLFASDAPALLMDEPIAALDLAHQHRIMSDLRDQAHAGRCVIVALHELPLAYQYADQIIMLNDGRLIADAPPEAALTPSQLRQTFGIEAEFIGEGKKKQLVVTGIDAADPKA